MVFWLSIPSYGEFGSIVDIGLAGDLYFTQENANNGQGYVNLLIQNSWSESQLWVDIGAGGLVGEAASSYVKVPQLYYRAGRDDQAHVIVGRVRQDWSMADDFWDMGIVQPIFKWNQALPEEQGLSGVFVNIPFLNNQMRLTLFGSYLFLPSQGPSYDLTDGRLTSSNPWFNEPVQVISLSGQRSALTYTVDVPAAQDIVFRHSFGFQLGSLRNKRGLLVNAFYLNKPRNDLMLPFEGLLNLSTFNGDITVFPRVARHDVAGVELGWNAPRFKSVFSWLYESSARYQAPEATTFPTLPEQNFLSFQQLLRLTPTQRLWLGYIHNIRQETGLGGVYASSNISVFDQRNRFENTVRVQWEGLLYRIQSRYQVQARLAANQSLIRDNVWLSAGLDWSVYKGLELFTHCDFFGGSGDQIIAADFISTYQNNDRCLVGGHYAF